MDLIEGLRPPPHQPLPRLGETPLRLFLLAGQVHGPHSVHTLAAQQTLAIDPQQFA